MLEDLLHLCGIVDAEEEILIPEPKLGALQICLEGSLGIAEVLVALREIEFVAGNQKWIGFGLQHLLQHRRIVLEFLWVAAARAVMAFLDEQPLTVPREQPSGTSRYSWRTPL